MLVFLIIGSAGPGLSAGCESDVVLSRWRCGI